ncbi:MAG: hypothetical protein K0R98_250 [Rickettsiaceae bacterium]|jgi:cytoplasmic iron level regulating protein YaaA (DUF328/UPF0246 family)|nr:hypothetical protein [Rickettsiaceae bacterium]
MDFDEKTAGKYTFPDFLENSTELISVLRKLKKDQISQLMDLSDNLAELNYQRYKNFSTPFTEKNSKQAAYAFKGDVYDGLEFDKFASGDVAYAQENLRMISGLYGLLRPLDLIQPYRLEMSTKLKNQKGKDLYQFWGESITAKLNEELANNNDKMIVNLASNEYWKAVKPKLLQAKVITPVFKENKNGEYKVVMLFAKRARGMMAHYIIKNKIENISDLKKFNVDGYKHNSRLSEDGEMVFTREKS